MTTELLLREKKYLAGLKLLHRMKENGLLSESEYAQARELLIQRDQPKISTLFG